MSSSIIEKLRSHPLLNMPTAIGSLALALTGLGNVWIGAFPFLDIFALTMSIIGFAIVMMLVLKYCFNPTLLLNDLRHYAIGASIFPAIMALMVVSKTWIDIYLMASFYLWYFAIWIYIIMLVLFLYFRVTTFNTDHILPSWFVPPVGIAISAVTFHPMASYEMVEMLFWFSVGAYFFMLPLMQYRLVVGKSIKIANLPTVAILAAPPNLCLSGYLTLIEEPKVGMIFALLALSLFMTATIYLSLFTILKLPFTPAFAALTFPAVIGATSLGLTWRYLESINFDPVFVSIIYGISKYELILATIMVCYVSFGYVKLYLSSKTRIPNKFLNKK